MKRLLNYMLFFTLVLFSIPSYSQEIGINQNSYIKIGTPSIYKYRNKLNKTSTSNFTIIYSDTSGYIPNDSRNALQEAVNIWSYLINTSSSIQDIKIYVNWVDLGYNSTSFALANCGPASFYNSSSLPNSNTQYPIALAENILNSNLNSSQVEIRLNFNNNSHINWYFGTDGIPQKDKIDFETIALHELAHGLGFESSLVVNGSTGHYGRSGYQIDTSSFPFKFDKDVADGSQHPPTDILISNTNNTTSLAGKLTNGNVYFTGSNAYSINNDKNVKLYAPSSYEGGSSISHLDPTSFPYGSSNSLMDPARRTAEVVHSPGEVTLAILADLGWDVNRLVTFTNPAPGVVFKKGTTDTLKWTDNDNGSFDLVLLDSLSNYVMNIDTSDILSYQGNNQFVWSIPTSLSNGKYQIKTEFGGVAYGMSDFFTISDQDQVGKPVFNPISGQYTQSIYLKVTCPTSGANIRYTNDGSTPTVNSTLYTDSLYFPFNSSQTYTIKAIAFKNGMAQSEETDGIYTFARGLRISQVDENGEPFGTYYILSYGSWVPFNAPIVSATTNPAGLTLMSAQNQFKPATTQKYNRWEALGNTYIVNYATIPCYNQSGSATAWFKSASTAGLKINLEGSSVSSGSVSFKDPWIIDSSGQYGNLNRSTSALWYDVSVNTTLDTNSIFKGIFLNEGISQGQWSPPYYLVKTPPTRTISGHTSYFLNWSGNGASIQSPNSTQTGVTFNSANATVTANYKGHLLSSIASATSNNNQRKIVQSDNDKWASVYVSLNEVWLTTSTDGSSWSKEIKLSDEDGSGLVYSSPSVMMNGNNVYVVWQGIDWHGGNGFDVCKIYERKYNLSTHVLSSAETLANFIPNVQSFDAMPVIDGVIYPSISIDVHMVIWRETDGLYSKFYDESTTGWGSTQKISGTDSYSHNPSIAVDYNYNGNGYILSWAETNNNTIKYMSYPSPGTVEQVSPNGWSRNVRPQITMAYGKPTVVWTSYNNVSEGVAVHVRQRSGISFGDTWDSYITSYTMSDNNPVSAVLGGMTGANHMVLLWNNSSTIYKASYNGSSWSSISIISSGSNGGDYLSINSNGETGLQALWTQPAKSLKFDLVYGDPSSVMATNGNGTSTGKILTKTVSSASSQISADSSSLSSRHTKHAIIELSRIMDNETLLSTKPEQVKDKEVEGYIAAEISWVKMDNNGKTRNIDFTNSEKEISTVPFTVSSGKTTLDLGSAVYGSGIDVSSARLKKLSAFAARITVNDSKTGKY